MLCQSNAHQAIAKQHQQWEQCTKNAKKLKKLLETIERWRRMRRVDARRRAVPPPIEAPHCPKSTPIIIHN
jgi:hypothetical protein